MTVSRGQKRNFNSKSVPDKSRPTEHRSNYIVIFHQKTINVCGKAIIIIKRANRTIPPPLEMTQTVTKEIPRLLCQEKFAIHFNSSPLPDKVVFGTLGIPLTRRVPTSFSQDSRDTTKHDVRTSVNPEPGGILHHLPLLSSPLILPVKHASFWGTKKP